MMETIARDVDRLRDQLIDSRRDFHRNPGLSSQEETHRVRWLALDYSSAFTKFLNTPMPLISTSTTSSGFIALLEPVVPEKTRSPG